MKLRIITSLTALFVLGGASGYLVGKPTVQPGPKPALAATPLPRAPKLVHIFNLWKDRLQLTPEQVASMQPVLDASDEKLRIIQTNTAEKVRALLRENARELRTRLTPEQQAEFEKLTQEMIFKQSSR
jgi:Spy/CpxP family protein refolding chaperone